MTDAHEPVDAIYVPDHAGPERAGTRPSRPVPVPVPVQVPEIAELTAQVALLTAHIRSLAEPLTELRAPLNQATQLTAPVSELAGRLEQIIAPLVELGARLDRATAPLGELVEPVTQLVEVLRSHPDALADALEPLTVATAMTMAPPPAPVPGHQATMRPAVRPAPVPVRAPAPPPAVVPRGSRSDDDLFAWPSDDDVAFFSDRFGRDATS